LFAKLKSYLAPDAAEARVVEIDSTPSAREEAEFFAHQAKARQLENQSDEQDMRERIRYANHAYGITQAWIGFLMVMTLAQFLLKPLGFGLDPSVFIAVFTTTTAAVFGFWLLVGQYLFHRRKP
jgi:hypothetical protein